MEVDYLAMFSKEIGLIDNEVYESLDGQIDKVGGKIWKLKEVVRQGVETRKQKPGSGKHKMYKR